MYNLCLSITWLSTFDATNVTCWLLIMIWSSLLILQRELACQTNEILQYFSKCLVEEGFPELRCVLCIGGMAVKEQVDAIKRSVSGANRIPNKVQPKLFLLWMVSPSIASIEIERRETCNCILPLCIEVAQNSKICKYN